MTLAEFKAWFEGYTEGMDSTPSVKQWDRIKARVKEIDGMTIIQTPVYVDRWRYWNPCGSVLTYSGTTCGSMISGYGALGTGPNTTTSVVTMLADMGRQDAEADA